MPNNISDEMYEYLQDILEKQDGKTYSFEEAKEIGDGLVDFYLLLMEDNEQDLKEIDEVAPLINEQ